MLQKEVSKKPPAAPKTKADAGAGAMGNMAGQLAKGGAEPQPNTMANAPVSKTNTAKPGNPNAAPAGNYDGNTGAPVSDKAKADAEFDASPEGQAMQAKVDAMGTTPTKPKRAPRTKAPTAPVDPTAAPAAPGAEPTAPKKKGGRKKPAAPSQAEIDADRDRIMGNFTDSVNRYKKVIAENAIRSGEISIFRKR